MDIFYFFKTKWQQLNNSLFIKRASENSRGGEEEKLRRSNLSIDVVVGKNCRR